MYLVEVGQVKEADDLMTKLKENGCSPNLLNLLKRYVKLVYLHLFVDE
jgi:pentatricopeptide repeat protein